MAISITQINQGADWVKIRVQGLLYNSNDPTYYSHKAFDCYLNRSSTVYQSPETYNATHDYYEFIIDGLNVNTSYYLRVVAFCEYQLGTTTTWFPDPSSGNNEAFITITTIASASPYFSVSGSSDNIYVQVSNISGNYWFSYKLYNSASSSNPIESSSATISLNYTFSNLSSGTYYIEVWYDYSGQVDQLISDNNNLRQPITISGGGGGGTTPTYIAYASNNDLIIQVRNYGSNGTLWTYIFDDPTSSYSIYSHLQVSGHQDSYNSLSNGIYYVQIDYRDDNTDGRIHLYNNSTGQKRTRVDIGTPTPPTGGKVYIFDGTQWRTAKPYIFDGTRWRAATPYIFDGTRWRSCT